MNDYAVCWWMGEEMAEWAMPTKEEAEHFARLTSLQLSQRVYLYHRGENPRFTVYVEGNER